MNKNNYQKILSLLLLFTASLSMTFAQDVLVKGKVSEDNGNLIYGVNVTQKGSSKGTSTNDKGEYSITVKKR